MRGRGSLRSRRGSLRQRAREQKGEGELFDSIRHVGCMSWTGPGERVYMFIYKYAMHKLKGKCESTDSIQCRQAVQRCNNKALTQQPALCDKDARSLS